VSLIESQLQSIAFIKKGDRLFLFTSDSKIPALIAEHGSTGLQQEFLIKI
jgi:hypothetical protein